MGPLTVAERGVFGAERVKWEVGMLWHYAFGKPKESLDVTVGPAGDLSELSTEDLLHRVDGLREQVREQAARERALPAEYRPA